MEHNKRKLVIVQMPEYLKNLLRKISETRGESMSAFIRQTIKLELAKMGYLSDVEKKALGLKSVGCESGG